MTLFQNTKRHVVFAISTMTFVAAAHANTKADALPDLWYDAGGEILLKIADGRLFNSDIPSF